MTTIAAVDGLHEYLGYTSAKDVSAAMKSDCSTTEARREKFHPTRYDHDEFVVERLVGRERKFFAEHYELAMTHAGRVARKHGRLGRRGEDIAETAAVDALLRVSRRSLEPDFDPARGAAFVKTAVERLIRDRLDKFFGVDGKKDFNSTDLTVDDFDPSPSALDPADEVALSETFERFAPRWARAVALIRSVWPAAVEGVVQHEQQVLRLVAHGLGIRPGGTNQELVERIAEEVDARLDGAKPTTRPVVKVAFPRQKFKQQKSGKRPRRLAVQLCG